MDSLCLLEEIKSKYIIDNIFTYIKEANLKYKLVTKSKKLQELLKITIQDYKNKCSESINYNNFLKFLSFKNHSEPDINILTNEFDKDIKKYKIKKDIFMELSEIYFINKYNYLKSNEEIKKSILDNQLTIDIFSPFYNTLYKKDIFEKLFTICIRNNFMRDIDLMDYYINAFTELSIFNPNFSCFHFEFYNKKDLLYFQYYNKNLKKIKKLILEILPGSSIYRSSSYNNDVLYKFLFSFNDIENNLIYLELKGRENIFYKVDSLEPNLTKINDLKVLEELRIEGFNFFNNLILELNSLKYLYLTNINTISLTEKCCSNLKIINLFRANIQSESSYLKLPNLEKFKISFGYQHLRDIFDLKFFQKLKYFIRVKKYDFLELGNTLLEKVYICNEYAPKDIEINVIKKLIEIKTLKEIKLDIKYNNNYDIKLIKGENPSVEKLIIHCDNNYNYNYHKYNEEIIFYSLQEKFPNLKEIKIYINNSVYYSDDDKKMDINVKSDCKINKFTIAGIHIINPINTKFIIGPYENLVDVEFGCMSSSFKLEKSFPIFMQKCNYTFKSLINFKYDNSIEVNINIEVIKNIINNLNKMPNLKSFIFKGKCKEISEEIYKKFIEELLLLRIKNIELNLYNNINEYSEDELKDICKDLNLKNFEKISIKKFN